MCGVVMVGSLFEITVVTMTERGPPLVIVTEWCPPVVGVRASIEVRTICLSTCSTSQSQVLVEGS